MSKHFKSLSEVIQKEKEFKNFNKSVNENSVINDFADIFPELTKTVSATSINNGVLYLSIENSVLKNELYLQKKLMIDKINKYYKQQLIADVKFKNF